MAQANRIRNGRLDGHALTAALVASLAAATACGADDDTGGKGAGGASGSGGAAGSAAMAGSAGTAGYGGAAGAGTAGGGGLDGGSGSGGAAGLGAGGAAGAGGGAGASGNGCPIGTAGPTGNFKAQQEEMCSTGGGTVLDADAFFAKHGGSVTTRLVATSTCKTGALQFSPGTDYAASFDETAKAVSVAHDGGTFTATWDDLNCDWACDNGFATNAYIVEDWVDQGAGLQSTAQLSFTLTGGALSDINVKATPEIGVPGIPCTLRIQ